MSIRLSLTNSQALTLAVRMRDLADLERDDEDVQAIHAKLQSLRLTSQEQPRGAPEKEVCARCGAVEGTPEYSWPCDPTQVGKPK